jgi:hypothetical protein
VQLADEHDDPEDAWPRAVQSLRAGIHLNALNNSYDRMHL